MRDNEKRAMSTPLSRDAHGPSSVSLLKSRALKDGCSAGQPSATEKFMCLRLYQNPVF